jgi:predicted dehydrogenase
LVKALTYTDLIAKETGLVRVGVIGCGYWGPNLVRNFFEAPGSTVAAVADLDSARLTTIGKRYPSIALVNDYREVLADPTIDAVCIALPVSMHYPVAREALEAGKHVWVEKPLAFHQWEAEKLTELAAQRGLVLMVDHTFVYTSAVRRMRESIQSGELGDLLYYDSVRVNLGLYQHDVNVVWDLGIHDVSIMDYLLPYRPVSVTATGASHIGAGSAESIAYVTLNYAENFIAHFHVNWLAPVKIRLATVCGSRRMIVYDDTVIDEKLRVYDRGITVNGATAGMDRTRLQVEYRTGDMYAPKLAPDEALQTAARHFVDCIAHGATPVSSGEAGCRAVAVLEATQRSLARGGCEEKITW